MTSLGSSSSSATEYTVRVPKNTSKKYNIMAFNSGDRVNCSTWTQARMERDMSARRIYGEEEAADGAAGSEFGKKQREEARRKKYGIVKREFKVEDQPWVLKVNGKAGKRFKGVKKGGVTENASYYIFTQCPDGAFEAFPVNGWYNFTPQAKHRTLTAEEAEEEWGRRNKVVNHFSIMLQRRFREQERGGGGDDDDDDNEKSGKKKKKGGGRGGDLRIHDLEDDLEMSSDDSDSSMGEDGDSKTKAKKDTGKGKGKKKKRKSSDKEALEDSDDGDQEGLEVDYMSDESSSDEEQEKGKPSSKGEDHPKGIDEASESEEESEEEKPNEEEAKEEEEEEEGKKTPVQTEKKKKKGADPAETEKDSSGESESSDDSDIDGETASALFMKKRTPPKRGGRGSAGSSRTGSRPGTPSIDSASTSSTLRAAASKLEQGKRQTPGPSADSPAAKRLKMEPSSQSPAPSGKSTPQPPSGKSTPSSSDVQLTEEAVRRYLIRKPMTTKDLLKKFQTKRTGLSSEQTVNVLAQILKRLNPERKNVNDKMHFYLTE
ncbi:general transcription factor IIF subunit 1 isoform X1 [Anarrhichthys ocellatus]|uniref:general transcription factor IIF subunit 1 isoform X1 n=1 Tax=Anarrhichthys ocellatus TaxID=433405 RepID=UPI0012EE8C65|nr:general transcription factor IIF subunit 1 isoform X1 [Anarrhichthys ocellatus]